MMLARKSPCEVAKRQLQLVWYKTCGTNCDENWKRFTGTRSSVRLEHVLKSSPRTDTSSGVRFGVGRGVGGGARFGDCG
eukprot:1192156-Prorocentrum_minimum.AAC.6